MDRRTPIRYACLGILCLLLVGVCGRSLQPPGAALTLAPDLEISPAIPTTDGPEETSAPTATNEASSTPAPTVTVIKETGLETALVVQVLDGDTVDVMIDGANYRLRYIGIDSPEDGQPFSAEAEAMNRQLVEGKKVVLEKDVSETDRYDRLLRYVFLPDGTFINTELVRAGMANATAYEPDVKYQQYFEELQAGAQAEGASMWGQPEATPTLPAVEGSIFIDPACSQFNAPGNDNDNKIEEYVCVVNLGTGNTDLSGWFLHDAYGWSYTFPAFSLQPGGSVRVRTGCGEDSEQDLHWCKDETAVWNNDTDCAYLLDATSKVVHEYCY